MTEIELKIDLEDLRSIYFRNNEHKYFFGPKTERQSIQLTVAVLIFPFFAVHALSSDDRWYFVLGCIFFSLIVYDFWSVAGPILKWKRLVLNFLKEVESVQQLKFMYNDVYFVHLQDKTELKQAWSVIDRAEITDRFIWLFSDRNILLPKNSMSQKEFELLSETVMKLVKNVEKKKD